MIPGDTPALTMVRAGPVLAMAAVSNNSEEQDATHKLAVYAKLGIPHYWIVRGDINAEDIDGVVTQYVLTDGDYEVAGQRLVSQLATE